MKTVINVILIICACALAFICVRSITDDQDLDAQIEARKKVVEARLLDIKTAEEFFKTEHDTVVPYTDRESGELKEITMGRYSYDFDELINFLKTTRYPKEVKQIGEIQEAAQRKGWTWKTVADKIYQLRQQGLDKTAIMAQLEGDLPGVYVDTVWAKNAFEGLFGRADYPIDSLRYIPFSEGEDGKPQEFELQGDVNERDGIPMNYVMECDAPMEAFTKGLGKAGDNKVINLVKYAKDRGDYPGLKIGDMLNWNNNAGNWE